MDFIEFDNLLPKFIKRWVSGEEVRFWLQRYDLRVDNKDDPDAGLNYHEQKRKLTTQDWLNHFKGKPKQSQYFVTGAMGICGAYKTDLVKWICWDADSPQDIDNTVGQIIPFFDKEGIPYILEYSSRNRCHLWVMCLDIPTNKAKLFSDYVTKQCNGATSEVYPFGARKNSPIRVPGGWHYKSRCVNPVDYDGLVSADPIHIMKAFINVRQLTVQDIERIVPKEEIKEPAKAPKKLNYIPFHYQPRELPILLDNVPTDVAKIASNCQCFNRIISGIKDNHLLQEKGIEYHQVGLRVSGMCVYSDIIRRSNESYDWFKLLVDNYRDRSAESHHWNENAYNKYNEDPRPLLPSCKTLEEEFKLCGGCPFRNLQTFWNPRQFLYNSSVPIERIKIGDPNLVDQDYVDLNTFPQARQRILEMLENKQKGDLLIGCPQGSGKSLWTDRLVAELATKGLNIIIAVPTAELAIEHQKRIEKRGQSAHILMSHYNTFKEGSLRNLDFKCPSFDDIQYYVNLGSDSTYYKKKYCKTCPYLQECPFPRQYADAVLPETNIVIIQHTHFKTPEALYQLFTSKQFDVMFVDESFTDNLITTVKPLEVEYEILLNSGFVWAKNLGQWMKTGGYPGPKINPGTNNLENIKLMYEGANVPFDRLRLFLTGYKQGEYLCPRSGLTLFYPVPEYVPIRVFTDATPPIEMLQIVLNNERIEIFGKNQVMDYRVFHPENKIVSVLDSSLSQSSLNKDEKFYDLLNFVGECSMTTYKNDKILVTVYKKNLQEAVSYLQSKFPSINAGTDDFANRVVVSIMKVGSNAFANFDVQFLLASVFLNGADITRSVYELKLIENYWRRKDGRDEIPNIYPAHIMEEGFKMPSVDTVWLPVRKTEVDGIYNYPNFTVPSPEEYYHSLVYKLAVGKGQQANRIRFSRLQTRRRVVIDCGNQARDGMLSLEVLTLEQLLAKGLLED